MNISLCTVISGSIRTLQHSWAQSTSPSHIFSGCRSQKYMKILSLSKSGKQYPIKEYMKGKESTNNRFLIITPCSKKKKKKGDRGWWYGAASKGTCHSWQSEFALRDPCSRMSQLAPECKLFSDLQILLWHICAHTYIHSYTQHMLIHFHRCSICNNIKTVFLFIHWWMGNINVIPTHNEIVFNCRKMEFAGKQKELKNVVLNEVTQTQKTKIIHM